MTKNQCEAEGGVRENIGSCVNYLKISSLCIMVDQDQATKKWVSKGICDAEYEEKLENSKEFQQQIDFFGYEFEIQVMSAKDPHVMFGI